MSDFIGALDAAFPDADVIAAIRSLLQERAIEGKVRVELDDRTRDIPLDVDIEIAVVTKIFYKEYLVTGFGATCRVLLALGGIASVQHGIVEAGECFVTAYFDTDCQLITARFHSSYVEVDDGEEDLDVDVTRTRSSALIGMGELIETLDAALPDADVIAAVRSVLQECASEDTAQIEIDERYVDIRVDTDIAMVTKAFFKEYYEKGFGSIYCVMVALGGIANEKNGIVRARECCVTTYFNTEGKLITTDFHSKMH